jgi:tight adherence protein C
MQYLFLGIGTVLAVLFLVQILKGQPYNTYVENLDENEFPLKDLYIVGFMWSAKTFPLKGKQAAELKQQAGLLYDLQYAEYYANVAWAQCITFVHLFLTATFLLSGVLYDAAAIMIIGGLFMTVTMVMYSLQNMKNKVSSRMEECEAQLPEVVSTMAILVNSGMMLREAWTMISESGEGAFHMLMRKASDNMRNGYSDADAIFLFGRTCNSVEIKKFTSALLQSMEKGGGELGVFLARQSSELWNTKRQKMLQNGEKASTKLLAPIVLIFVGIIIIVMTAAFAGALF